MTDTSTPHTVKLGATDIMISPVGIGTWAWGDRVLWGYRSDGFDDGDLREAFDIALDHNIDLFDTAEVYGLGRSEELLGRFIAESGRRPCVATKFLPLPWRWSAKALVRALRDSLKRLGLDQVDLYQIHWPMPLMPIETLMEGMADAVEAGLTQAVGVSNFNVRQMERAQNALTKRGLSLTSNQVHYSLLHRKPEIDGVLQLCRDLNVTLIAYSPLEMGILTGKYTPDNPPPRLRRFRYSREFLAKAQPLVSRMREIGEAHDGGSSAQVALNWLLSKGTVPIPGAKNARHAASNAQAMTWRLTEEEVEELDTLSRPFAAP
ncbi:MAG: aldo/keto reductase [Anaerolineae bacterium]